MSLSRQQYTLLGIFALFFGPVLLVMLMRSSWWQYQPSGLKNNGYLVQPPVHLSIEKTDGIDGKWLILYVLDDPCEQECIDNVTNLRQIHRATGRNGEHLVIALLSGAAMESALQSRLETIYPEFYFVVDSDHAASNTLESINTGITTDAGDIRTYVLDPMLNVILAYRSSGNPTDIHKDLKRLLKWSDQAGK